MRNVYLNEEPVNCFDTVDECYDFAISIEYNLTDIDYKEGDRVTFNGEDYSEETTDSYNMSYNENLPK